jgi:hypothetical protein
MPGGSRPVGGLLSTSEYKKKSSLASSTAGDRGEREKSAPKLKFVPNMKRKTKLIKDEEDELRTFPRFRFSSSISEPFGCSLFCFVIEHTRANSYITAAM